ncbi:MAG: hypothetical protein N2Z59_03275, partial [Alteraurantiacibacter sp.]|nr:hypothetical protein [Alteraurantiacibacter sp.]
VTTATLFTWWLQRGQTLQAWLAHQGHGLLSAWGSGPLAMIAWMADQAHQRSLPDPQQARRAVLPVVIVNTQEPQLTHAFNKTMLPLAHGVVSRWSLG